MNIFVIKEATLFIVSLLNFLFAWLIWSRGKSQATFHLGWTALFSALYALILGLYVFSWDNASYNIAIFFDRATWAGALILPAFVIFSFCIIGQIKNLKTISFLLYLTAIVIIILSLTTPLFVKALDLNKKNPFAGEIRGILNPIGRIYILVCLILGAINLLKYYFQSTGFKKLQSKFFLIGSGIYLFGGVITTSLIPLVFKTSAYIDVPAFLSSVWIGLTSYAIFKYRLLDITLVLGRMAIYFFCAGSLTAIAYLLLFLNNTFFSFSINLVILLIILINTLIFSYLFRFFEKLTGRYFYYTFYTLQQTLQNLVPKLNQNIQLEKLTNLVSRSLLDAFNLEKIAIILKHPKTEGWPEFWKVETSIKFNEKTISSLLTEKDSFLIKYLQENRKPITKEEIAGLIEETKEEVVNFGFLKQEMDKLEIGLFLPLLIEEELKSIIVLGNKLSGDAYTVQDFNLLTNFNFSVQVALAFNNALSFEEIEKRKAELEKFYNITVGRELKMIELKEIIKEKDEKIAELESKLSKN